MFRQAKLWGHEYLSGGSGYYVARNFRLTASRSNVQFVSMEVSPDDLYRCRENLVTREIAGETMIVPIGGQLADLQKAYSLNATGSFIWEHLDGNTSLDAIHRAVAKYFKIGNKDAWTDLAELVADLARAGLIEKAQ